jgi:hypothetical protein
MLDVQNSRRRERTVQSAVGGHTAAALAPAPARVGGRAGAGLGAARAAAAAQRTAAGGTTSAARRSAKEASAAQLLAGLAGAAPAPAPRPPPQQREQPILLTQLRTCVSCLLCSVALLVMQVH